MSTTILGTILPTEIEATCNKHACGFFYVNDLSGKRIASSNVKNQLQNNVNIVIQRINAIPENTFLIAIFNQQSGKNKTEYNYYLTKNTSTAAPLPQSTIINHQGIEPARTLGEALKDARELAELQSECKRLGEELARVKKDYEELATEQEEEEKKSLEEAQPSTLDKVQGFMKDILPAFMPLAEKYLEIQEKNANTKALQAQRQANPNPTPSQQAKQRHPFRPLPQADNLQEVEKYLSWLERVPEHIFNKEIEVLEISTPDLCTIVKNTFINNTDENDQE